MFGTDNTNAQSDNPAAMPVPSSDANAPAMPISPQPQPNPISGGYIETPMPEPPASNLITNYHSPEPPKPAGSDDLLKLKQEALQSLAPMVGKLDQSPEEKFKTLMMLIQASDNTELVKEAYEAAKQITDEKERAQALIDVVNEINYFTQQHNNGPSEPTQAII